MSFDEGYSPAAVFRRDFVVPRSAEQGEDGVAQGNSTAESSDNERSDSHDDHQPGSRPESRRSVSAAAVRSTALSSAVHHPVNGRMERTQSTGSVQKHRGKSSSPGRAMVSDLNRRSISYSHETKEEAESSATSDNEVKSTPVPIHRSFSSPGVPRKPAPSSTSTTPHSILHYNSNTRRKRTNSHPTFLIDQHQTQNAKSLNRPYPPSPLHTTTNGAVQHKRLSHPTRSESASLPLTRSWSGGPLPRKPSSPLMATTRKMQRNPSDALIASTSTLPDENGNEGAHDTSSRSESSGGKKSVSRTSSYKGKGKATPEDEDAMECLGSDSEEDGPSKRKSKRKSSEAFKQRRSSSHSKASRHTESSGEELDEPNLRELLAQVDVKSAFDMVKHYQVRAQQEAETRLRAIEESKRPSHVASMRSDREDQYGSSKEGLERRLPKRSMTPNTYMSNSELSHEAITQDSPKKKRVSLVPSVRSRTKSNASTAATRISRSSSVAAKLGLKPSANANLHLVAQTPASGTERRLSTLSAIATRDQFNERQLMTAEERLFADKIQKSAFVKPETKSRAKDGRTYLEGRYAPLFDALDHGRPLPDLLRVRKWKDLHVEAERADGRRPLENGESPQRHQPGRSTGTGDTSFLAKASELFRSPSHMNGILPTHRHTSSSNPSDMSGLSAKSQDASSLGEAHDYGTERRSKYMQPRQSYWNVSPADLDDFVRSDRTAAQNLGDSALIGDHDSLLPAADIDSVQRTASVKSTVSRSSIGTTNTKSSPMSRLSNGQLPVRKSLDPSHIPNGTLTTPPVSPHQPSVSPESPKQSNLRSSLLNRFRKSGPAELTDYLPQSAIASDTESYMQPERPEIGPRRGSTSTFISELWSPDSSDNDRGGMKRGRQNTISSSHSHLNSHSVGHRFTRHILPGREKKQSHDLDNESVLKTDVEEDRHHKKTRSLHLGSAFGLGSFANLSDSASSKKLNHHHLEHDHREPQSSLRQSQMADGSQLFSDPFANQLSWKLIPGLDISGPVFPNRRVERAVNEDDKVLISQRAALEKTISSLLHRIEVFSPRAPTKMRAYLDQLSAHVTSTKQLSRQSIHCQTTAPLICARLQEELSHLPEDFDFGYQFFANIDAHGQYLETTEPLSQIESASESEEDRSSDEVPPSYSPKARVRAASQVDFSLPRSPMLDKRSSPRMIHSRRHTVAMGRRPSHIEDMILIDPLPELERSLDSLDKLETEAKASFIGFREEVNQLKQRVLDVVDRANSVQEYNEAHIEKTLGQLEETLLKVKPPSAQHGIGKDFLWTLCAAALSSVFWLIRIIASIVSLFATYPLLTAGFFVCVGLYHWM